MHRITPTTTFHTRRQVIPVSDHILGTMAGGAADCTFWLRYLGMQVRQCTRKARPLPLRFGSQLLWYVAHTIAVEHLSRKRYCSLAARRWSPCMLDVLAIMNNESWGFHHVFLNCILFSEQLEAVPPSPSSHVFRYQLFPTQGECI